ncbi:hypothetical protein MUK42_18558 [Musa troglodytarum]|uniref:Uncharacterized protein n=1 Tax=Musa troglodytarum TaxID=320322 RepID=A0A9E7JEM6_9LILI|nr:hypothetical protein MUK42_18558 [Musa troglodytarum]
MEDISLLRAVLAILQWWGPNVTVISMNKWLFQMVGKVGLFLVDLTEFGFQVSSNSIIRSLHKLCTGAYTAIKLLRMKPLVKSFFSGYFGEEFLISAYGLHWYPLLGECF